MSETPRLELDTTDPTPPYEQLRRQFAELIEAGVLAPAARLPPLRQLAADLGLAVGTVARTYRELEAAGLVSSRRGGGTRVREQAPRAGGDPLPRALARHAEAFVRQARLLGARDEAVRAAVEAALVATEGNRTSARASRF